MPLFLDTGFAVQPPSLERDELNCLVVVPNEMTRNPHGALLAVAEGVGDYPQPEETARETVKALGDSYYAAPESWSVDRAIDESYQAANRAIRARSAGGGAATLSALVLRQRRWTLGHAGDTRVWLRRDHQLKLLTRDHVVPRVGRRPLPLRACGFKDSIETEITSGDLVEGDIFVLTTSGVHDVLNGALIMSCLTADSPALRMAECLVQRAAASGGRGPMAVCVARVEKLPPETALDLAEHMTTLPVTDPPEPEESLDGFQITRLMHKSRQYRLYEAVDTESGSNVVLKFPNPRLARDPGYADSFLREEWIGKRIESPYLIKTLPVRPGRRSALYTVMVYQPGENLSARIKRKGKLSIREAMLYGGQLVEVMSQLHREGVLHGAIRTKNILIDKKRKQLLLLGLEASQVAPLEEMTVNPTVTTGASGPASGSGSHLAPELFAGDPITPQTDIYAAGVVIYRMLTGRYPYGRIGRKNGPPDGNMTPASAHNPEVPSWLDELLAQACALNPHQRLSSAADLAEALTNHSAARPSAAGRAEARAPTSRLRWEWLLLPVLTVGLAAYLYSVFRG
jgi:protein phosphatase